MIDNKDELPDLLLSYPQGHLYKLCKRLLDEIRQLKVKIKTLTEELFKRDAEINRLNKLIIAEGESCKRNS